jgi:hypothetical protein
MLAMVRRGAAISDGQMALFVDSQRAEHGDQETERSEELL